MGNEFRLSKNEMEIMNLLWNENRPLSKAEIVQMSTDKSWKSSSVYVLLKSLLKKGAIEEHGFVKSQTNIGRTFIATITKNDYAVMQINLSRKESNLSMEDLIAGLVESETDLNVIKKLESIIESKLNK